MINILKRHIRNKKLLILGFGREGKSTYNLIRKLYPEMPLYIADKNEDLWMKNTFIQKDENLVLILGDNYLDHLPQFELVIKSPGISLNHMTHVSDATEITSQTDLFMEAYRNQTIGITGSKGKSTTSSLIYHIISQYTENCLIAGNIGIPAFDIISKIDNDSIIVYELSAHQLEFCKNAPDVSILLNLYEEHLDHFHSFEKYQNTKLRIADLQRENSTFIYHADDHLIRTFVNDLSSTRNLFGYTNNSTIARGCFIDDQKIWFADNRQSIMIFDLKDSMNLQGQHNYLNIMASILACLSLKIPIETIRKNISTFKGLEHRLEFIGTYRDIKFYNDSIATIPEATMSAITTLETVDTLILGGFDRGIYYTSLLNFISESTIKNLLFTGTAGKRMMEEIHELDIEDKTLIWLEDYVQIVDTAFKLTKAGKICLLSPAAASYDSFWDFEQRGEVYKKLVEDY
ncbi:MAG: UDP-N-acetylmuramoyl-L-alanine--D-glutamate ligase [Bacteroidales bacterium]|nr:UDP-N-acetylmuramoyl-L-alanine--D-glutamate ligase [Bacteroidales bacterium]